MGAEFVLEWDDFTGGYFVGPSHANQPSNTWRGTNVIVDPNDGMLNGVVDWTAATVTSGTPGGTTTTGGYVGMWTDGDSVWRLSGAGKVDFYGNVRTNTANVGVINYNLTTVTAILDTCAWSSAYIFACYTPSSGTDNYVRIATSGGARTYYTLTEKVRILARWGEFMVGAGATTPYRLYYSNAYTPETWSGDFIDIGDAGTISCLVPFGDTLFIGKPDGWWAVTGVPGVSDTVRRVASGFPGPEREVGYSGGPPRASDAVATPFGVMYTSTQLDYVAAVMNGDTVEPFNLASIGMTSTAITSTGVWVPYVIQPGYYMLTHRSYGPVSGSSMIAWTLDTRQGDARWAKINIPYHSDAVANPTYAQGTPARLLPDKASPGALFIDRGTTIYTTTRYPTDDITTGQATATVELAERRQAQPFTVTALYAEVCWSASASAAPSVAATVEMRGSADIASPGRYASTSITQTPQVVSSAPESAPLYHDDRFVHATLRFTPDGLAGTSVLPSLVFSECKVRRVWALCKYQDQL